MHAACIMYANELFMLIYVVTGTSSKLLRDMGGRSRVGLGSFGKLVGWGCTMDLD